MGNGASDWGMTIQVPQAPAGAYMEENNVSAVLHASANALLAERRDSRCDSLARHVFFFLLIALIAICASHFEQ
jgi:lysozyme family protein